MSSECLQRTSRRDSRRGEPSPYIHRKPATYERILMNIEEHEVSQYSLDDYPSHAR